MGSNLSAGCAPAPEPCSPRPDIRIIDIALAVGYQTPSAFRATFRKALGARPTEYRRRLT
jgi:AraC-like DNA-binding protein